MPRRHLLTIASMLAGIALAAAGCTIPTTGSGDGYGPSGQAAKPEAGSSAARVKLRSGVRSELSGKDFAWSPTGYLAAAGSAVVLDIRNRDTTQHNFTLGDVHLSQNIPADGHTLVRFTAPKPGRYRFYCKYHQQEMQGWLTVT
jgi:plastocyanin